MNIILIPARGGSKRIPRKNLKPLGGKPLLLWTIEAAKQLDLPVWVSTENMDVANCAWQAGVRAHERSTLAATDVATDHDVVWDWLDGTYSVPPDTIIYLRPTTPFRSVKLLHQIIDYQLPVNYSSIRSVHEMPESSFKTFTRSSFGDLEPVGGDPYIGTDWSNEPNQFVPKTYTANGYIDILFPRRQFFRRDDIFGPNIFGHETPPTIELDTLEQWDYAEYLVGKGLV